MIKKDFIHKYSHLKSLEGRFIKHDGIIIFGLGGCMKYNDETHQYSEAEMKQQIRRKWYKFLFNN